MKLYNKVVPYLILGSAALFHPNSANAQNSNGAPILPIVTAKAIENLPNELLAKATATIETNQRYKITQRRLIARAENTRDMYMENMLAAQKRISPAIGTKRYRGIIRKELPGAPVGKHCMYGQYTQLLRALNENGDTLTVIPRTGKSACIMFKDAMRKKYSKPEYAGVIKEGHAYPSDSAYNAALEKFLVQHRITDSTASAKRKAAIEEFQKNNFSIEQVKPGSILIVPRRPGSRTLFHAIMFLGRGHIESGEFIPDANGQYMYAAHNNERIGNLFETWDMSYVFSANIEEILRTEYSKELKRLESMSSDKMIEYITRGTEISGTSLAKLPRTELVRLVQAKYFGDDITKELKQSDAPSQIALQQMVQVSRT